ncbi:MAG: hypothetical protein WA460_07610, partial [Nitrososphaeraceae archaeon]
MFVIELTHNILSRSTSNYHTFSPFPTWYTLQSNAMLATITSTITAMNTSHSNKKIILSHTYK